MSEVSELTLLIRSPRFSYLSAAWWKSSSPPCKASVRAAACPTVRTGGSGESLAAGVRGLWCVPSPAPCTCLAWPRPPRGGPCCHPGSVMSPDVPLGLGCSSSDFVFSMAVEGEGEAVACGPWACSSPPGAEGPRGELGQVEGLGRWYRAGGCPALGQPPVWMGWWDWYLQQADVGGSGAEQTSGECFFSQARVTASAWVLS